MVEKTMTITDPTGIHARPATVLVNKAGQYESDINITYNNKTVNLKSIMGIMSLGIPEGAEITVTASGADEEEALQTITETVKNERLGE